MHYTDKLVITYSESKKVLIYSPPFLNTVVMGHVPDQEKDEQRTLQRRFWLKDPSVVTPKEDPDNLGTPWIQQAAVTDKQDG